MIRPAVARSTRGFLVALLSLLLLGMQSEGLRHALAHQAAALTAPEGLSLQVPNDLPCVECKLLPAGTNAIVGNLQTLQPFSVASARVFLLPRSTPQSAPSYYQSRAPPALL